jgi:hypothetical protein
MAIVFESKLKTGFLNVIEADGRLYTLSGFTKAARGVCLPLPDAEAADLAEALLRHLGEPTARSVYESVVRDAISKELPADGNGSNNDTITGHDKAPA